MNTINRLDLQLPQIADYGKAAGSTGGQGRNEELLAACQEFEAIFVFQLFKAMRKTAPEIGAIKIPGRSTFDMMMDQKLSQDLAKKGGGIGLGRLLYEKLSQESKNSTKIKDNYEIAD